VKRIPILFLLTAMFLCVSLGASAASDRALPSEIASYFVVPYFSGSEILDHAELSGHGSDDCWFVAVRKEDGENFLYCFKRENGSWEEQFHTNRVVPQTKNNVIVQIEKNGQDWPSGRFDEPRLTIARENSTGEYWEFVAVFELHNSEWLIHHIYSYIGYDPMLIRDGSISYYRDIEGSEIAGTATGVFQRDLLHTSFSAIPKTLAEARAKLTYAPRLPASSELQTYPVTFTESEKYDVYSAPDVMSRRGANGKARVSTNSWIQVFGTEGDWVLIQYSIDASHYRFGYISTDSLPKKAKVPALSFEPVEAWTVGNVILTDDPLYSNSPLLSLPEGAHVSWLASLGEWAYVEVNETKTTRGFIPLDSIAVSPLEE